MVSAHWRKLSISLPGPPNLGIAVIKILSQQDTQGAPALLEMDA
jgi:hypothetical protein